jgi:flagellar protein FliS
MAASAPNPYLRMKVLTASPSELRLMLFDGALKFSRQGRRLYEAEKPDLEKTFETLVRAQKIVLELANSLVRNGDNDEIYEKLSALYHFIYTRLIAANSSRDVTALDEAIQLLEYERETWLMVMERVENTAA